MKLEQKRLNNEDELGWVTLPRHIYLLMIEDEMTVGKKPGLLIRIAWLVIILSGLTIGGFLLWDLAVALWFDRSQPIWLRMALAAFYIIFALLFLLILRERLMERKTNKAP